MSDDFSMQENNDIERYVTTSLDFVKKEQI